MIQINIFEESHEIDCMNAANEFLSRMNQNNILDIKYASSHFQSEEDQVFSFSVCIIYSVNEELRTD